MGCPKCHNEFEQLTIRGVKINHCRACNAVWIRFADLKKLSEALELTSEIVNPVEMEPTKVNENVRNCPDCGSPMSKIYFSGTTVDVCRDCNAILFDDGELAKYFGLFMKSYPQAMTNIAFIDKYCSSPVKRKQEPLFQEIEIQSKETEKSIFSLPGFIALLLLIVFFLVSFCIFLIPIIGGPVGVVLFAIGAFLCSGFKILKPQEAMVFTFFGSYCGTLRGAGFHWVNPFAQSITPFSAVSLKAMTLDNGKQKINDELGNPIEVGIMVIWEVRDTAKAMFNVNNYVAFISAQCDSALRNIVRMYPYDAPEDKDVISLRGDSAEISAKLKAEIQRSVKVAGINIVDAKITHLAYAPEIAVAMLQRQQATAIIDAKKAIVEGAVGMVEMALNRLSENNVVQLNEVEKAKMVNNLLVTLCSNKEAQPVVKNSLT